ncbi:hypothetical protein [Terrabacter terrigena]|uniref:Uncharacterized protein n=1 Tax=Terrabacter terrigena TaxID=574718 RepID=A0ABW3MTC3_9MICO
MSLVIRSAAALTAALAVVLTVSPVSAAPSNAGTNVWCFRADPGTNGPCPVLRLPASS